MKNNAKDHKVFLSDDSTKMVLISKTDSIWSKINSATHYISEAFKKNTDN